MWRNPWLSRVSGKLCCKQGINDCFRSRDPVSLTCRSRSMLHLCTSSFGHCDFCLLQIPSWRERRPICRWSGDFVSDLRYFYSWKIGAWSLKHALTLHDLSMVLILLSICAEAFLWLFNNLLRIFTFFKNSLGLYETRPTFSEPLMPESTRWIFTERVPLLTCTISH